MIPDDANVEQRNVFWGTVIFYTYKMIDNEIH